MKRLFKFIAWLAGLAVFLLITAHFTLRHALNTPKFKEAMTGFIERTTGRAADYERIDYSLFPFALVIRNAAIKEPDGSRDFASILAFSAIVDFRTKEISALRFEQPSIRIVQRADGTFNFSDLMAAPPAAEAAPPGEAPAEADAGPATEPVSTGTGTPPPAPPAFAIRLIQIEKARFEFVRADAEQGEESFLLSNLDFQLQDFAPDRPFKMNGRVTIGQSSELQFDLSGPALAEYAQHLGAWPIAFGSRLDLRDFDDLKAFLPDGMLPFQNLEMSLKVQGALADKVSVLFDLKTSGATDTHPVAMEMNLKAQITLPGPVVQHVLAGAPLPEEFASAPPPCEPPPGAMAPANDPMAALLLRYVQATAELTAPIIAYGRNRFEQGTASALLRDGVLTIPGVKLSAYGGTLEARANAQLLACPLTCRLDRLVAENLAIEQALAANGLGDMASISGQLQFEARASGYAVAEPGLRALEADAQARIDDLQSVGTGGSLMDQVWLQLGHPLLLKLVPRLEPKVEQAKRASETVTTSRYDEATATLSLRNGTARLSDARLAMPGYRLDLSGTILPFDDRMDLSAQLVASPEETMRLTDGKDLSAYLPYENSGLLVPLAIRGPLQKPEVRPDLDRLLQNALAGTLGEDLGQHLDDLSDSDKKHVQEGLQLLQGLGTLLQGK